MKNRSYCENAQKSPGVGRDSGSGRWVMVDLNEELKIWGVRVDVNEELKLL